MFHYFFVDPIRMLRQIIKYWCLELSLCQAVLKEARVRIKNVMTKLLDFK